MDLIKGAAYLRMCGCGMHGTIVCADGTESEPFFHQEGAKLAVQELAFREHVVQIETYELYRHIKESSLLKDAQEFGVELNRFIAFCKLKDFLEGRL